MHPPRNIPIASSKPGPVNGFPDTDIERKCENFYTEIENNYVGPIQARMFIEAFLPDACTKDAKMPLTVAALNTTFSEENSGGKNHFITKLVRNLSLLYCCLCQTLSSQCDCINLSGELEGLNYKLSALTHDDAAPTSSFDAIVTEVSYPR